MIADIAFLSIMIHQVIMQINGLANEQVLFTKSAKPLAWQNLFSQAVSPELCGKSAQDMLDILSDTIRLFPERVGATV